MFPSARPGETIKRILSEDDLAAITKLYGLPAPEGCTAAGGGSAFLALIALGLFAALARRRRPSTLRWPAGGIAGLFAVALALPLSARAALPERPSAPVDGAQAVLVGRVTQVRTLAPTPHGGHLLLFSEVTLTVDKCLAGTCPETVVIHVAGGRWGHLEQLVADAPVPKPGATVGLTIAKGTSPSTPAIQKTRVYDLGRARDFSAFAKGLTAAHLPAAPGSR
jgi:uncharacterized protein (TIGR03382 family)